MASLKSGEIVTLKETVTETLFSLISDILIGKRSIEKMGLMKYVNPLTFEEQNLPLNKILP